MDRLRVHQNSPKQAKAKKKPIKVVYISNPMKVTASPAEFRSLVQELTGQDSYITDIDLSKFPILYDSANNSRPPSPKTTGSGDAFEPSGTVRPSHGRERSPATPFEVFEEVFDPQMLENFSGFMPSSQCYESHLDGSFWSFEKV